MDTQKIPIVSVVVPVYNVETYLPKCIESVLRQEFGDWELILVDDGSTDLSYGVCRQYAIQDSRITLLHQDNAGVSAARNKGLSHVRGEWCFFLDADDSLSPDFFSEDWASKERVDVILKPFRKVDEAGRVIVAHSHKSAVVSDRGEMWRHYVVSRENALWNKIIRSSLMDGKSFNPGVSVGEDFLFFLSLLPAVKRVQFSEIGHYDYLIRRGSAMASVTKERRAKILLENIANVREVCNAEGVRDLGNNIIFYTYLPFIFSHRGYFAKDDYPFICKTLDGLTWRALGLLPTGKKIKRMVQKYICKLLFYFGKYEH